MYKQIPFDIELIIYRYIHRSNVRLLNEEHDKLFKSHFDEYLQYFRNCDNGCRICINANYRPLNYRGRSGCDTKNYVICKIKYANNKLLWASLSLVKNYW